MSASGSRKFPAYITDILSIGGVGVIITDTIYGVAGSAMKSETVKRIYGLRKRDLKKPFVILIHSESELKRFGVKLDKYSRAFLSEAWPGPISVILPVSAKKYEYLHRGKRSLAFRVPDDAGLRSLLRSTGPLVAPSANPEGKQPARTLKEAQKYFGPKVEFYMDAGRVVGKASTLIDLTGSEPVILRK
jgi:L-threonylcarbamoyladenylate synthase